MYNTTKETLDNLLASNNGTKTFVVSLEYDYTHYDVCFVPDINKVNNDNSIYQRGLATQTKSLGIGINGKSFFIFTYPETIDEYYSSYVAEKLQIYNNEGMVDKIVEIIKALIV